MPKSKNLVSDLLSQLVSTYPQRAQQTRDILRQAGLTEAEIDKYVKLKKSKPKLPVGDIPTLDAKKQRPATPMLKARFEYAAAIHDVANHFLSLEEIAKHHLNPRFTEIFESQQKHWRGSAPATVSPDRLSLFCIQSLADGDVTYLVWPKSGALEPELWRYSGQHERKYKDLSNFLQQIMK